ncbi:MAG TPA: ATP-binding protein [Bacteroidales bacterium]|nr:ATP-binding protein [Bacteroidales bacterium]
MSRAKAFFKNTWQKYIYLFIVVLSFLLILGGYYYYKEEAYRIRKEKYLYLKTITDFKIDQILEWKKERLADAVHFSSSPLYVDALEKLIKTRDKKLEVEIIRRNKLIKELRGFESVFIATPDKLYLGSTDSIQPNADSILSKYIDSVFIKRTICFSDFYINPATHNIHLPIISPIINRNDKVVAALVFLVDPANYFYPLVNDLPIPSKSSEVAILRRNGDSVLFVNEMRNKSNTAFSLAVSVKKLSSPAVQAILGREGQFEGIDYRNVEVLSDVRHIEGTNWFIVTKVDKAEIFSELRFRAGVTVLVVAFLILLSIAGIGILLVLQQRKNERAVLNQIEQGSARLKRAEFISKTGNWEMHLNDGLIYASLGAQQIYGMEGECWPASKIQELTLPEYRSMIDLAILALVKNGEPYDVEFKIKKPNTEEILWIRSVAAYDDANHVVFGTIQDITEFRKQENLLHEKDIVFQSLMEFSPVYIFFKDHDIKAIHLSRNYEKMIGLPLSEILGKTMFDLFPSDLAKNMVEDDKRILTEGQLVEVDEEFNGRYFTTIKFPIEIEGMKPMLAGFTLDITDRKKAEQSLMLALERAEKSDKLKDAFLQNMSHEIRTPLNAIVGFSELLTDAGITPEKLQNYSSIIINSSNQLLSIVNDILTVARIQTGQEVANYTVVNVNKLCDSLQYIFNSKATEKRLLLSVSHPLSNENAEIFTDTTKLNQILSNLISNSLRFTHSGTIDFGYVRKGEFLEFYVKDTGIGIKPEHQEFIFERFAQADVSINKKYGGTGLGLSICKAYVQLLGGKIWVESTFGQGAEFLFTIPYKEVISTENQESRDVQKTVERHRTILIAEDEDYNYQLIAEILSGKNITLLYARNGFEAVEICKRSARIDLVLMDIKMPEMDGQTAMRIIKGLRPNLPIIAQTAYVLSDEKEHLMKSGFVDYITKPIKREELLAKINKY